MEKAPGGSLHELFYMEQLVDSHRKILLEEEVYSNGLSWINR